MNIDFIYFFREFGTISSGFTNHRTKLSIFSPDKVNLAQRRCAILRTTRRCDPNMAAFEKAGVPQASWNRCSHASRPAVRIEADRQDFE
ncbi:MAG: hypothetical protein JHC57_22120 [Sphingopyxis sp.]|uniref:hypothetical protein n=1 Tax=Sphingopyxis sp. TaxID=1908224 RepID=UPI001A31D70A|nr:hypothetical protein [Sphingopyxis sp.]MBJ7502464.1 hypothetical protein [Sphingopyxis sp.]